MGVDHRCAGPIHVPNSALDIRYFLTQSLRHFQARLQPLRCENSRRAEAQGSLRLHIRLRWVHVRRYSAHFSQVFRH